VPASACNGSKAAIVPEAGHQPDSLLLLNQPPPSTCSFAATQALKLLFILIVLFTHNNDYNYDNDNKLNNDYSCILFRKNTQDYLRFHRIAVHVHAKSQLWAHCSFQQITREKNSVIAETATRGPHTQLVH